MLGERAVIGRKRVFWYNRSRLAKTGTFLILHGFQYQIGSAGNQECPHFGRHGNG